jgi:hypothetical protein
MSRNPCLEAVIDELAAAAIYEPSIATNGNGHLRIQWFHGDELRYWTIANTPGDTIRGPANDRAAVRRILRADGLLPEQKKETAPVAKASHRLAAVEGHIRTLMATVKTNTETIAELRKDRDATNVCVSTMMEDLVPRFGTLETRVSEILTNLVTFERVDRLESELLELKKSYAERIDLLETEILKLYEAPVVAGDHPSKKTKTKKKRGRRK